MSAKARFTQADITCAVAGAIAGGMQVGRVEIWPDGRIAIVSAGAAVGNDPNPWDEVLSPAISRRTARLPRK